MFNTLIRLFPVVVYLVAAAAEQYSRSDFPADFVFGASTSAYQYEGAAYEEGRTPSVWDTFAHSGRTNGANGDIACDGYHKYKDDIKLMHDMGLEAFRFSISWSRLIPNGRGHVNPQGLKYYNDFIKQLKFNGIEPHVTLHHVDLPQALEDEYGGWLSRNIVEDFTAYADVCFREFGDKVLHWTSVNEANIFVFGGYSDGFTPPGRCSYCNAGNSSTEPYIVAHNILLAHSAIAKLYKEKYEANQKGYIGLNIYAVMGTPYTNTREDILATQRFNNYFNNWFLNPLFFGDYPEIVKTSAVGRIPTFTTNESKQLKGSLDFVGVNHYFKIKIKDDPNTPNNKNVGVFADMRVKLFYDAIDGESKTLPEQLPIRPSGLYEVLEHLKRVYDNPPIYIHENGQTMKRNETLIDKTRVDYIRAYMGATLDAIRNGSNTKGYFVWTLFDCLELLDGYESSYGFYYVDLDDKELKRSVWLALESVFAHLPDSRAHQLRDELQLLKKGYLHVSDFTKKYKLISDQLQAIGCLVSDSDKVAWCLILTKYLRGLGTEFNKFLDVHMTISPTPPFRDLAHQARNYELFHQSLAGTNLAPD